VDVLFKELRNQIIFTIKADIKLVIKFTKDRLCLKHEGWNGSNQSLGFFLLITSPGSRGSNYKG
jgi:hypothetical protein